MKQIDFIRDVLLRNGFVKEGGVFKNKLCTVEPRLNQWYDIKFTDPNFGEVEHSTQSLIIYELYGFLIWNKLIESKYINEY